ncbi:alpha/beta hydrolase [Rhodococcus sp. SGAir0479]|uniref:alpha/beta hydrolase n=1 Tax=Rhodococcus sp. SGAir0479 TaxID=2567884 RepID=UPI0010CCEB43|nr:alpha/beta hydrolase [Rhodococcus sp. SGAir0479]QCQ93021.1 hypothetical protein E7742_18540 [Rhodococcus sp. SGAir0479]
MTAPSVSHAGAWGPQVLVRQAQQWRRAGALLDVGMDDVGRAVDATGDFWGGSAADAARAQAAEIRAMGARTGSVLHAAALAADEAAVHLGRARDEVLDAVGAARAEGFEVGDDGTVGVAPPMAAVTLGYGMAGALARERLRRRAGQHGALIGSALGALGAADGRARSRVVSAFAELPREGEEETGWVGVLPVPIPPRTRSTAAADRAWWDGLSAAQQQTVLGTSPDVVGSRDGLPAQVRHHANVARLASERVALEDARETLAQRASTMSGFEATLARRELVDVTSRLLDLDVVEDVLRAQPDRLLLLLDTRTGEQVRAAVAVGDPDDADHVAVTTPGMNAGVRATLPAMTEEAAALRDEAQTLLRDTAGRADETVSVIAWLGYDPPRAAGNVTDVAAGGIAVAQEARARAGARDLARFYDGLGAAHTRSDPHLTAIGHSYGSVTAGLALVEPGRHPVDDLVVYGSPGLVGVQTPSDLRLGPGHAYEMTAADDVIAHLDRFGPGPLGGGPYAIDGFVHLATESAVTPDGVHRDGATGHSQYPRLGDNGRLRTSGYNLAAVVAGLPDRAVLVGAGPNGTV